ncbi:MAG: TrbC/VirB2 family protein [Balneolaceae bacterium]|nr:TrbC/VirB2 family protein [Balneolaceae bacterium]
MKKFIKGILGLLILITMPVWLYAAGTGTDTIGGELMIVEIVWDIIEFLQGGIAIALITLGIIVGAAAIAVSRANDASGWHRIGKVVVGGSIVLAAVSIVGAIFQGAVV